MPQEMTGEQVQISNYQSTAILKELSDIKANQAVNQTETANIKATIGEIKTDIREIKVEQVTRREYNELLKVVANQGSQLQRLEYWQAKVIAYASVASVVIYYGLRLLMGR